jgi:hypothetical protein
LNEGCIDVERIATVLELPGEDPRRRHVESCPRCRNLARSYTEFMRAEMGPAARPDAARDRLAEVILDAAGKMDVPEAARQEAPELRLESAPTRWWSSWRLRSASLVAATAAITLLAVILWPDHSTVPPLLRDDRVPRAGTLSLLPAEAVTDGHVGLTWTRAHGADRYEVRVYSSELDEIYRHPAVTDTSVVIRLSDIPTPPGSPGLVWRVYAFRGSDVIAVSPPGAIPLP